MKSNKENTNELFGRLKDLVMSGLTRLGSKRYPILRLSQSLFRKSNNKAKLLKEKYSFNRERQKNSRRNKVTTFENLQSSVQISSDLPVNPPLAEVSDSPSNLTNNTNKLPKYINKKTVLAAAVAVAFTGMAFRFGSTVEAYAVEVNGKNIATVSQQINVEKFVVDLKEEKTREWKRKVDMNQQLTFKKVKVRRYQLDNAVALKQRLNKSLTFEAVATGIKVNGQIVAFVKDAPTAEEVLKRLKESYKDDQFKIENIAFQEKIEIAEVPASLKNVLSTDEALKLLKEGKQQKRVYHVKEGDSLWTIARANDMRVKDLKQMNPSLSEDLDLGQEINLVAIEPMVNVVMNGQITEEQELPYKVVVETDKSMPRGKEKVKTEGEKGLKQVTFKVVIKNGNVISEELVQEKVVKTAKDQVVVRGKKQMIASRSSSRVSSRSGGKLSWPLNGRITSGYGRRGGEHHTGIDIDGVTGQPVGAAAAGVVIDTGRAGGYGKMVLIRHENGLVTRYAHLSSIGVSSGDRVDKGEVIGRVGSTGRSTGSHLHFEVINGGSIQNPMKYLR